MADSLISKYDVLDTMYKYITPNEDSIKLYVALSLMPSAKPKQKRGKWIKHGLEEGHAIEKYTCSECGYYSGTKTSNFCPDCGADMRKEQHE